MFLPTHNAPALWRNVFPLPTAGDNKYTRGSTLVYGGELMTGAARLAARAAQRMGAGLVTIATTADAASLYRQALESVIVRVVPDIPAWRAFIDDSKYRTILIGPGLGLGGHEMSLVKTVLESRKPCVLDAGGLSNYAGKLNELLPLLHDQCILTPHEEEFARLFGDHLDAGADRIYRASQAAKIGGCVVVLKGAETIIAAPDGQMILNNNAPPWLATGGSGDVLAGMILGLVTQKMPSQLAAAAATWIHGRIAADFGPGLIAGDLVDGIPQALKHCLQDC